MSLILKMKKKKKMRMKTMTIMKNTKKMLYKNLAQFYLIN